MTKFCPLFEKIEIDEDAQSDTMAAFNGGKIAGIAAANAALPQEPLRKAIQLIEAEASACEWKDTKAKLMQDAAQLRALLTDVGVE